MRARREPSTPPTIPGFQYVRVLGLGGFADVFEYRQELPQRSVAVKVLLASSLDPETRDRFFAEANLMAQLSHHPSIVTIYHADIATDGRPFLVMEYCSRPGLGARYRSERITVAEALRTGIRLASAVEAAHRLGILHRDIKPANILTTDYGWPALTDFGIAATTGGDGAAGTGMSIPWSPPELLAEHPTGDRRGDVYSLGATIYSMLAGRSPFEIAGQSNGPADLISRIERVPLPAIDRSDVPAGLQALLARCMTKEPARRYDSALAVARALQQVERSLGLTETGIDLSEDLVERVTPRTPSPAPSGEGESTRLRPIVSIEAQPTTVPASAGAGATRVPAPTPVRAPGYVVPPPMPTSAPSSAPSADPAPSVPRRRGGTLAAVLASVVVIGALVLVAALTLGRGPEDNPTPTPTATAPVTSTPQRSVPAPTNLLGSPQVGELVRFQWTNPEPMEGDTYRWQIIDVGVETAPESVDVPYVDVAAPPEGERLCIEVSIVRSDRRLSNQPAEVCYP
ncbi:serine/threonine protein kinase [Flavimobilis marinus]|uniref:non-specific serine/threonine protein kinase n=1 Tax=Flavimobilis marinus TaxID=285351 RepID=A0A1I2CWF8_9MICO|nr:serine/threonine-protein kinase [Flavimobilis marinus]GHG46755.1 serine/threonine protein kinase [Flavimobilis marinus]SFE72626.1 Serine/threonine protein kinase [Flavimobilis marinus]